MGKSALCSLEDSYSWLAVRQAAENASSLGADPSRGFIISGTSAGGNLSAVLSHLCRDEKLSPPVTGTLNMIPSLVAPTAVPEKYRAEHISYKQNEAAPVLSRHALDLFLDNYCPDVAERSNQPEGVS